MGLEAVKEEIIRDARKQEESLLAEARGEADKLIKSAEKQVVEFREKSELGAKRLMEVIKKQELASAELENKKMLLEAKKQLIDAVFAEAHEKIDALASKKREVYIKNLLEKAKSDIEVAKVYCSKKDASLLKGVNTEVIGILGGLIAETKDGTVRVDYSFETLLQNIKESELQNISKIIFD